MALGGGDNQESDWCWKLVRTQWMSVGTKNSSIRQQTGKDEGKAAVSEGRRQAYLALADALLAAGDCEEGALSHRQRPPVQAGCCGAASLCSEHGAEIMTHQHVGCTEGTRAQFSVGDRENPLQPLHTITLQSDTEKARI